MLSLALSLRDCYANVSVVSKKGALFIINAKAKIRKHTGHAGREV